MKRSFSLVRMYPCDALGPFSPLCLVCQIVSIQTVYYTDSKTRGNVQASCDVNKYCFYKKPQQVKDFLSCCDTDQSVLSTEVVLNEDTITSDMQFSSDVLLRSLMQSLQVWYGCEFWKAFTQTSSASSYDFSILIASLFVLFS